MVQGIIRFLFWTDTRDMLADGLTKGGIDRTLLDAIAEHCTYKCQQPPLRHCKCGRDSGGDNSVIRTTPQNCEVPKQQFDRQKIRFQPRKVRFTGATFETYAPAA